MFRRISRVTAFFFIILAISACSKPSIEYIPPPVLVVTPLKELVKYEPKPLPLPPRQLGPLVVIDAGHGGSDNGTRGRLSPEYIEKDLTLTTAVMVKGYLDKMGFNTLMIRQSDVFMDRYDRARIANEKQPKVYVSIHYNFAAESEVNGIEVFYFKTEKEIKKGDQSKLLAQSVLDRVIARTGAKSRGVKHGNYAVIRETNMPAILIEGGFMTNEKEMDKLKDPVYVKELALGIAEGIKSFIK